MPVRILALLFTMFIVSCSIEDASSGTEKAAQIEPDDQRILDLVNEVHYAQKDCRSKESLNLPEWYVNQTTLDKSPESTDEFHATLDICSRELSNNIEAFTSLVDQLQYIDPIAIIALQSSLTTSQVKPLLPYLSERTVLANMSYRLGLHEDHFESFLAAFDSQFKKDFRSTPEGLVLAIIDTDFALRQEQIEQILLNAPNFNILQAFEMLNEQDTAYTRQLAQRVWDNALYNLPNTQLLDAAFVAARYAGDKDALAELALHWAANSGKESFHQAYRASLISNLRSEDLYSSLGALQWSQTSLKWSLDSTEMGQAYREQPDRATLLIETKARLLRNFNEGANCETENSRPIPSSGKITLEGLALKDWYLAFPEVDYPLLKEIIGVGTPKVDRELLRATDSFVAEVNGAELGNPVLQLDIRDYQDKLTMFLFDYGTSELAPNAVSVAKDPLNTHFIWHIERLKAYRAKLNEQPNDFIQLTARVGHQDPYVLQLIHESPVIEYKPWVMENLTNSEILVNFAYVKGWHRSHKAEFMDALNAYEQSKHKTVPVGLAFFAYQTQEPELMIEACRAFLNGFTAYPSLTRLDFINLLIAYQAPNVEKLAKTLWEKQSLEASVDEIIETATIAARFAGDRTAMLELAYQWQNANEFQKGQWEAELSRAIRMPNLSDFYEETEKLVYRADKQAWFLSSLN